jgi:pSer/pThr/pTyr-binding forkhead associated (FHA) protein
MAPPPVVGAPVLGAPPPPAPSVQRITGARRVPPPPAQVRPAGRTVLNVYYNGQRFPVTKERFVIGRGRQTSDLTIKDPNVSRQHAMIEFLNGQYYMVDMGSTNGVEYSGQRVQRQIVQEGDIFRVCDHDLRCSFQ